MYPGFVHIQSSWTERRNKMATKASIIVFIKKTKPNKNKERIKRQALLIAISENVVP